MQLPTESGLPTGDMAYQSTMFDPRWTDNTVLRFPQFYYEKSYNLPLDSKLPRGIPEGTTRIDIAGRFSEDGYCYRELRYWGQKRTFMSRFRAESDNGHVQLLREDLKQRVVKRNLESLVGIFGKDILFGPNSYTMH